MGRRRRRNADDMSMADVFDGLRGDYEAAKSSRWMRTRRGLPAMGAGSDYHYRSDAQYLKLMELARDMDRNDTIVGQTIDRAVTNQIQDGFMLHPDTGDPKLDRDLSARWTEYCETPELCDLAGEHAFYDQEYLAMRQTLVDGDICFLPTIEGSLEAMEAHRLRTPKRMRRNIVHGVHLDDHRRRLAYFFCKQDVDPFRQVSLAESEEIAARDSAGNRQVFHVYSPKRASQTRGITALAPIFMPLAQFEDINFAKLVQQQIVSCFTIFRMMDARGPNPPGTKQTGAQQQETLADGTTRLLQGISPGMEIRGAPGEKLEGFSPNVPNETFFEHVKLILTLIGVNLGLPLVMVLLDAKETNFSGWRGAVDQARMGFRRNQRALIRRFHRPVYWWKLDQWMADDPALRSAASRSDIKIRSHRWDPPSWPYIEPVKDAAGDLLRVRNALTSHRRRAAERSMTWDSLSTEIVEDNALAIKKAIQKAASLNAELGLTEGQRIHWRELISLPTPDGVSVAMNTESGADSPPSQDQEEDTA